MTAILNVHTRLSTPGGANRFIVETSNRLVQQSDISVDILSKEINTELYQLNSEIGVLEFGGPPPGKLRHWLLLPAILRRVRSLLKSRSYDYVIFHSTPLYYWIPFISKSLPETTFVWYAHSPNTYLSEPRKITDIPRPMQYIIRAFYPGIRCFDQQVVDRYVDDVLSNSQFTSNRVEDFYNIQSRVIHPGVDQTRFTPENRQFDQTEFMFSIGQINNYKNFDVLLKSFQKLVTKLDSPPELVIGGIGQEAAALRNQIADAGLKESVSYLGYITESELTTRYANAAAVLYLPENEPFGLVPIEAMASGTPVIGPRSGGLRETIVDGETGILLDELTATTVADAITTLVRNNDLRRTMGEQARRRVITRFSWEQTLSDLIAYF